MFKRGGETAQKDRRKPGVARRNPESKNKKSIKIPLTENDGPTILPLRQSLPSSERSSVPPPIRTPEKQSARSAGVCPIRKRDEFVRNGSGSHSLQDMWSRPIPDAHRKLPPLCARLTSALGVPDSSPSTAGGRGRGTHLKKVCQSGDGREYRPAHSPTARIAQHDPEPAAIALKC